MNIRIGNLEEVRSMIREGLQILSEASDGESYKLNSALIKFHSALEIHIRTEVARKEPHLQNTVLDMNQTSWYDLIVYGKKHLGFSESDVRYISLVNRQVQDVVHGKNYSGSRSDLLKYGEFVQRWFNSAAPFIREFAEPGNLFSPAHDSSSAVDDYTQKPWYRSTLVLWLAFLSLTPAWSLLIITDRKQGGFARFFAHAYIFLLFISVVLLSSAFLYPKALDQIRVSTLSTGVSPVATLEASDETIIVSDGRAACAIIWTELKDHDLDGKNRSMVWKQIVLPQIKESGMTARDFYTLVVEHNPGLKADGYVFKKEKTYFLPECQ